MNTRERIEFVLRQINGNEYSQKQCFNCEYSRGISYGNPPLECQKVLALVLVAMGVPRGVDNKMFQIREAGNVVFVQKTVYGCHKTEKPDPDWQEFIDEVVTILGE